VHEDIFDFHCEGHTRLLVLSQGCRCIENRSFGAVRDDVICQNVFRNGSVRDSFVRKKLGQPKK
jgi:hypothetical protein